MDSTAEFKAVTAIMQKMNRNVFTLEDKANLSVSDSESMSVLSRLERDIILADADGIQEELQSLTSRDNAAYVMRILERDLESIGINCSWTKNSTLSLQAKGADLVFRAERGAHSNSPDDLKMIVGKAISLTKVKPG
ncbi:MAG: hypothetical protein K2Y22_13825 [Candidatus Obscuribacterales bacterium]|nr:hypothetical protein [Candidatus Obscuribacterales bacterium]